MMDLRLQTRDASGLGRFVRRSADHFYKVAFVAVHVLMLLAVFVEVTWTASALCVGFYILRMFGVTAGYHRYFAHRSYKTSRWFQFALAFLGCSSAQRGPLWWVAVHRSHHRRSDTVDDPHSPVRGFFWSHCTWIFHHAPAPDLASVKDLAKFPELRWLDRLEWLPPSCVAAFCYAVAGWSGVVWGYVVGTVLLYHGTFLVNSVCHIVGTRRYATADGSRNNALVALLTLGEGWHNNHHQHPRSARQGIRWWEIDLSYYVLCMLALIGIVWDVRKPPSSKVIPIAMGTEQISQEAVMSNSPAI